MSEAKWKMMGYVVLALLLGACAGQAKIDSEESRKKIVAKQYRFHHVAVYLTQTAKEKEAVNKHFDRKQFVSVVTQRMKKEGLVSTDSDYVIEFYLNSLHVRGTIKTLLPLPSKDLIEGEVIVKDRSGKQVERFPVDATYVIGGTANALPQIRTKFLYSNFAKIVSNVFTGKDPNKHE